jgi:hypothetical protein
MFELRFTENILPIRKYFRLKTVSCTVVEKGVTSSNETLSKIPLSVFIKNIDDFIVHNIEYVVKPLCYKESNWYGLLTTWFNLRIFKSSLHQLLFEIKRLVILLIENLSNQPFSFFYSILLLISSIISNDILKSLNS